MSPLWWMQSTAPHWTVMVEEVSTTVLTDVGAADGAEANCTHAVCHIKTLCYITTTHPVPESLQSQRH